MSKKMSSYLVALVVIASGTVWAAAPSSIGTVRSAGDFRVDGSVVRGNATVFDGGVVETADARSVVQIDGAQPTLAQSSRARIDGDRMVLEKGSRLLRTAGNLSFEADSLRISPAAKNSAVQIDVKDTSHISVFALAGKAQVFNSKGLLLANLNPGMARAFDAPEQTGANASVTLRGTVTSTSGKYFLKDVSSGVVVELRGQELNEENGKKIELVGAIVPNAVATFPATEVFHVISSPRRPGAPGPIYPGLPLPRPSPPATGTLNGAPPASRQ